LIAANSLRAADIASIFFTITPDLDAAFPAMAVRALGWNHVAVLDAQAPPVPGDVPRCIRVLIHWNSDQVDPQVRHVYLRDARRLRPDR
ncbi:MAG: chorismate mutase, partial [Chloroflexota bacterium]